ncbi:MAG: Gldg family protein [Monoglobales bacterium]
MKNINKKYLVTSWIITALVIVSVIFVNLIASSLTDKFSLKLDLTETGKYEISDITKKVMADLDKDVRVMVMGKESEISGEINEYLRKYAAMSDKFNLEYIDVYKNQVVLNDYQAKGKTLETGDIILECGERFKIINSSTIYNSTLSFDPSQANYSFELESKLTNGIVVVTGLMNESSVYILEGHGETSLDSIKKSLDTFGFSNSSLNLVTSEIPEDAGLIVSVVPTADFTTQEVQKLEKFFDRGGNLLMVFSPGQAKLELVGAMLQSWGIVPNYDLVLEKDPDKVLQYEFAMLTDTYGHEITNTIRTQSLPLVSYQTSSFSILPTNVNNAQVTTLLETTNMAIGKTNFESANTNYEDGDIRGPLSVMVISEKYTPKQSRVAVIGSIGTLELAAQYEGNNELLSGIISWMTNNSNTLKISPKIVSQSRVNVSNSTLVIMNYLLVWIIPIIILLAGIVIWIRRRYL